MAFFTEDTLIFWRGLRDNNRKQWFDQHRSDYEQHLREPYLALAEAVVTGIIDLHPEYEIEPRKATYRINRDIRFSKDKSPYKTELGITVGRTRKHDGSYPGFTARVGVDGVAVGGGLYMPDTELRDRVRRYVGAHREELHGAVAAEPFASTFGAVIGDAHKRAPAELRELAEVEPLVLNKQWVFWAGWDDPQMLLRDDLDVFIVDRWEDARAVVEFLKDAVTA